MTPLPVAERRRHTASLVLRPVDALLEALKRPAHERRPVAPVRLRLAGRVVGTTVHPLLDGTARRVRNLSGDTVFVDLALPAGTYRLELERGPAAGRFRDERYRRDPPRERGDDFYEELDPRQRDLLWDPDVPSAGLPDGTPHVSKLVELKLRPSPRYPFPPGSTLVRGTLFWYDGAPLAGAEVSEAAALVAAGRLDERGGFALAFPAPAATGPATVGLDITAVDQRAKPQGRRYLQPWPSQWVTQWRRGATVALRQAALEGRVLDPDGRPLPGAAVKLRGRPGSVTTDADGRWRYHFPPAERAGTVDVRVKHLSHTVVLPGVAFAADATSRAPVIRMV